MPSTNKTPNLRLNNWIESDIPKRIDFVSDNVIIDNLLGGHINDNGKHLTTAEKGRVSEPYVFSLVQGTGTSSAEFRPGFTPKMAVVFKTSAPPVKLSTDSLIINYAIATQSGGSGGASLSGDTLTLTQNSAPSNGTQYNLNESGSSYVIVYFK